MSIEDVTARVNAAVKPGMPSGRGREGPPGRDEHHRAGVARQDRAAERRGHALPRRAVPPLPLQEVHRRAAGLRPGAGRSPSSAAIRTTSSIPATTWTSASSASTRTASRPRSRTSSSGAQPGPATASWCFVSGHPGQTDRLNTVAHLEFLRDRRSRTCSIACSAARCLLSHLQRAQRENARRAKEDLFGVPEQPQGPAGRAGRAARPGGAWTASGPRKRPCATPWPTTRKLQRAGRRRVGRRRGRAAHAGRRSTADYDLLEQGSAFNCHLFHIARDAAPPGRGNAQAQRRPAARVPRVEPGLAQAACCSPQAPIYDDLETVKLADSLSMFMEMAGADRSAGRQGAGRQVAAGAGRGAGPGHQAARRGRAQEAGRGRAGGDRCLERPDDRPGPARRSRRPRRSARRTKRKSRSRSARPTRRSPRPGSPSNGTDVYPDATFTLRLAFGVVKGYEASGQAASALDDHRRGVPPRRSTTAPRIPSTCRRAGWRAQGPARPRHADELRLHGRHHRRQLRQPGGQPARASSWGSSSTATSSRWSGTSSTRPSRAGPGRPLQRHSEALRKVYDADALADELGR